MKQATRNKAVTIRVPKDLLDLVDLYSKEQHIDVSSAMRQWLYRAAEDYALKLAEEGRISGGHVADILNVSLFDIYRMAEVRGIRLGADEQQQLRSREYSTTVKLVSRETKRS